MHKPSFIILSVDSEIFELLSPPKKVGTEAFWTRVDEIARARLEAAEDNKLHLKAADTLHRELLQELDR